MLRPALPVVLSLLLLMALPIWAEPISDQTAGEVKALIPDASRNAHPLAVKDTLAWNDLLQTDAKGRVRAGLADGSILSLGSNSQLKVVQHDAASQQTVIDLNYGKLRNQVVKITRPAGKYEVRTPNAVIGAIGTDFYVAFANGRTTVICYEGVISVTPEAGAQIFVNNTSTRSKKIVPAGLMVVIGIGVAPDGMQPYAVMVKSSMDDTDIPEETASHHASDKTIPALETGAYSRLASDASQFDADSEAQLVSLINQSRTENGLQPLAVDPRLTQAARKHTQLMTQNAALSHQFPGEPPMEDRFDAEKIPSDLEVENVGWDLDAVSVHNAFMGHPPHRRNILDPDCNVVGIGVVRSGKHIFVTEDFARRTSEPH
jgi:uncharacterized protein YkwD